MFLYLTEKYISDWKVFVLEYVWVLVSYGCHNTIPQIGWLETTEIYCLTVMEARNLKSKRQQDWLSLGVSENLLHTSLLASGGC